MNITLDDLHALATQWLNSGTLIAALALILGLTARQMLARQFTLASTGLRERLSHELLAIIVPYSGLLALLGIGDVVCLSVQWDQTASILLLKLALALAGIRALALLVRLGLTRSRRSKVWEIRLAFVVWLGVALHLLGWLEAWIALLDSVSVTTATRADMPLTLWSVIRALSTAATFVVVSAWIGRALERRLLKIKGLAATTRIASAKFVYAFTVGFGGLAGLSASGLNLAALSVFGGALGLGLGFGLQSIAANFVSGFVLLMDRSIKPGDVISFTGTIGTSTQGFGWVQALRGRYVVVRDRDGVETLVPNQTLITNQVINWSYSDTRVRLKLPVRISYQNDPEHAMSVLIQAADCSSRILRQPEPVVRLMGFHDYGFDLELRFWIADPQAGVNNVRSDVNRSIWKLFKQHGIVIPRAQLDVRMFDANNAIIGQGFTPAAAPTVEVQPDLLPSGFKPPHS